MKFGLAALFVTCIKAHFTAGCIHELGGNTENGTKNLIWQNQIKLYSIFQHGPFGPVQYLNDVCMVLENECVINASGKLCLIVPNI
jgi:hypothetical protein